MDYLIEGLIFLAGLAIGFLVSYTKEKGKNLALKEDIGKLEKEKQDVQIKYTREIEELKKNNTLEVELRKHKYQDKKNQFSKFFMLLDEFHNKSNAIFTDKFMQIFSDFMNPVLSDDDDISNEGIINFNKGVADIFNELNEELLKVTTETNSIRLVSSLEIDALLDELNIKISEATNTAQDMIKLMTTQEFLEDQATLEPLKGKAEQQGIEVINLRNEIKEQMKKELDEI